MNLKNKRAFDGGRFGAVFFLALLCFSAAACGRRSAALLFDNSDFEKGTLENWKPAGTAFSRQPVLEDNPVFRGVAAARPQGQYWIGTYENRRFAADPKGKALGDELTGQLVSKTFTILKKRIRFLIGGGQGSELAGIALEVGGKRVLFEPGRGQYEKSERLHPVIWDVREWLGKKARIVIVDNARDGWGHINADDFRYTDEII